jgi:uncharacterized membrane protein YkvI
MWMKPVKAGNILKYSGSIMAFLIGSGFASGQEVMQFFSVNGTLRSGLGALISLVLVLCFYTLTIQDAVVLQLEDTNAIFQHYCGRFLGTFFAWVTPVFLFMVYVIMISGADTLLFEFYGFEALIGRIAMSLLSLITVLLGLNRLVAVVGRIGPVLIVFIIAVGIVGIIGNPTGIAEADTVIASLTLTRATPYWWFSGITYAGFIMFIIMPFLAGIGRIHPNRREAVLSVIIGGGAYILTAMILSYGILARLSEVHDKNMPAVFIANLLHPGVGTVFSVILYAGLYTTAVPMLWSCCNKISANEKSLKFRLSVIILVLFAFFGGQLPFAALVNIVYPYMGYFGILLFLGMVITHIRGKRASSPSRH